MIAFRHILSPVDFSEPSRHALDHALAIAQRYGGTITALHVIEPFPYTDPLMAPPIVVTPEQVRQTTEDLKAFAAEEAGRTPVETAVVVGKPISSIVEEAERLPADLIVVGTHGRRGFEHLMLGSVTERVLRQAPCPVLTVPPRQADAVPAGPLMYRRILCGVDFSPASTRAMAYAASLAKETGARLTVMHVVEPQPLLEPVLAGGEGGMMTPEEIRRAQRARLRAISPRAVAVADVVVAGKPYRELLAQAQIEQSDLIVIGVHEGLADRLHLGSVANHIVRGARCPVLSLRA